MSFERFMVFPVELLRQTAVDEDSTGDDEVTYPESGPVVMAWAEQARTTEVEGGRDTVTAIWKFASDDLRFGELEAYDRLRHAGHVFEIDGAPTAAPAPEGIHHWEVTAYYVEG